LVSNPLEIGFWRNRTNKTTSSIIRYFMIFLPDGEAAISHLTQSNQR
jgi:hypothetical protein